MARATAASTVADALGGAIDALGAAGVDSPRLDAELLLADATGLDRARMAAEPQTEVDGAAARAFGQTIRRRIQREPVAYILGRKGFRRIELAVDGRVLVPRPETELLVEIALELKPGRVLDVGTGSGAVALAVAEETPEEGQAGCHVVATDTSEAALELAKENAGMLGLGSRVRFAHGTLPPGERFDLVLGNLPYVSEAEWDGLGPEIRKFEPRQALVAGPTGLESIESLLAAFAREPLTGAIALEVGEGQAPAVTELVREAGFAEVSSRRDLAGIERVVVGRVTGLLHD